MAQSHPGMAKEVAGIAIIAHPSVPATTLSQQQVLDFYVLETNRWEDGSLVVLFDQKQKTASKEKFYRFLKKEPRELKKVWMRVVLSGEGRTPRTLGSEEEVVQEVAATPGAIGYVSADLVTDDVVVLRYVPAGKAAAQDRGR
ncbi:MAG: hypothetical protein AAF564_21370 [Bacteroidota bacterium]